MIQSREGTKVYCIRKILPAASENSGFGITIPARIAKSNNDIFFTVVQQGNDVLLKSGCAP